MEDSHLLKDSFSVSSVKLCLCIVCLKENLVRFVNYPKVDFFAIWRIFKYKWENFFFQVVCQGQVIGLILAKSQIIATEASLLVHVRYEELEPIITIEVCTKNL